MMSAIVSSIAIVFPQTQCCEYFGNSSTNTDSYIQVESCGTLESKKIFGV